MDSLLSTYASSSDDEDEQQQQPTTSPTPTPIPQPQLHSLSSTSTSTPLFSSLPEPESTPSLPLPLSQPNPKPNQPKALTLPPPSNPPLPPPKRVVLFKPPTLPLPFSNDSDDDEDNKQKEEERDRSRGASSFVQQDSSARSFLSSLPAPQYNSGGFGSVASGASRRSIFQPEAAPVPAPEPSPAPVQDDVGYVGVNSYDDGSYGYGGGYDDGGYVGGYEGGQGSEGVGVETEIASVESYMSMGGGKRRRELPGEIIEVKQDELMKDRPREDKSKMTGLAFGPSYQPASTKGKPSKLHKRKHQISALYFDMRQKEMEMAERRSKGLLTKAETQAKYGW